MYYIFMYYYILYFLSFPEILRLLFFFLCLRNNPFKKFFMYDKLKNYYFIKDMYCKDINLKQRNLN